MRRNVEEIIFDDDDITRAGGNVDPTISVSSAQETLNRAYESAERLTDVGRQFAMEAAETGDPEMTVRALRAQFAGTERATFARGLQEEVTPPISDLDSYYNISGTEPEAYPPID